MQVDPLAHPGVVGKVEVGEIISAQAKHRVNVVVRLLVLLHPAVYRVLVHRVEHSLEQIDGLLRLDRLPDLDVVLRVPEKELRKRGIARRDVKEKGERNGWPPVLPCEKPPCGPCRKSCTGDVRLRSKYFPR